MSIASSTPNSAQARQKNAFIELGAIPTVLGHSILNWDLRHMRGQVVAIENLYQFVFAGVLAYRIFAEVPARAYWIACILVVSGAIIVIRKRTPA